MKYFIHVHFVLELDFMLLFMTGYSVGKSEKSANSIMELDELDLSEDESTDFEMFNPKTRGANRTKIHKNNELDLGE